MTPIEQSSLGPFENRICMVDPDIQIQDRSKTGPKKCPENDHLKTGRSGIRIMTVSFSSQRYKISHK
jgi:hypothetical protein